ncbi:hypothetical protein Bbelb_184490 [Branchiostoma belcheri]|nr:hypothetical protein Bbelb_184490 [Branchiostoma belcheri]
MAASSDGEDFFINSEHQALLRALKSTVEGLLATRTSNVFSTYGGLPRMYRAVEDILRNGLKERRGLFGNVTDYWAFIKGLRWLHPTLAPALEKASRFSDPQEPEETDPGRAWLRKSLENHNLATQLKVLTDNKDHLRKCYEDSSFLCNQRCVSAMLLCLQAVEQNNPAILAQIDPTLLTTTEHKNVYVRSASLPAIIGRESITHNVNLPLFSPPREKEFVRVTTTAEHATPISSDIGLSPDGKSAARNVLMSILEGKNTDRADVLNSNKISPNSRSSQLGIAYNRNNDNMADLAFSPVVDSPLSVRKASSDSTLLLGRMLCQCNTELGRDDLLNANVNSFEDGTYRVCQRCGLVVQPSPDIEKKGPITVPPVRKELSRVEENGNNEEDVGITMRPPHTEPMDISPVGNPPSTPKKTHVRSKSDANIQALKKYPKQKTEDAVEEETASLLSSSLPARVEAMEKAMENKKHEDDKDETDSGVAGVTDSTYISRPMEGEFLMTYLSAQDFRTCPDLDKENAHFSISEALIAAIEQIRCTQVPRRLSEDEEEDASDEEIQKLKHQIRVRRRERLHKRAQFPAFNSDGTSITTSGDTEPFSSPPGSTVASDSCPSSEEDDSHRQTSVADSSVSQTAHSSFSESDSRGASLNPASDRSGSMTDSSFYGVASVDSTSAEAVAISLLKKFSHNQLPKASDLEWLVSEQDVPQALLPMPTSLPVSPDEGENSDLVSTLTKRTRLRGNLQWAPPRAQVIFNIHPPPKRKVILAKQSYMCAGCGTKVEPGFMKRFRYCEYLGKYFCQCCHTNASSMIPGKILHKWDFRKYYVSNFSLDLINKMHAEPLFNISDINPALYRKVRALDAVRDVRQQLYHLRNFLRTCRLGQNLYAEFEKLPDHLTHEPHIYSISDLLQVKSGELVAPLKDFVEDAVTHVKQCELCQAKGFYCEVCGNDADVIFPFEVQKCSQCALCGSCFHRGCFHNGNCPKCARIRARREQLAQAKPSVSDSSDDGQD